MVGEPSLAREIGERFDHVLVDEYQDTNRLQASILLAMKPDGKGLTVVGDDAQSIYSFRAATVRNILDFPNQFAPSARVVTLERNYRSTQAILDASNAVIGLARERFTKNLWTERAGSARPRLVTIRDEADQARCVAEHVLAQREQGMALKSQAVLFRSCEPQRATGARACPARHSVREVRRTQVPGSVPHQGRAVGAAVGRQSAQPNGGFPRRAAPSRRRTRDGDQAPRCARRSSGSRGRAGGVQESRRRRRRTGMLSWPCSGRFARRRPAGPPSSSSSRGGTNRTCTRLYDDAPVRLRDLVQLHQIASTYSSRERFLTEMALDPPDATSDEAGAPGKDDDYLILSTIHSAKGQEWKSVQILNVVDGCIPSDMGTGTTEEIEEERRLLYVAMTRAKDDLQLMVPQRFYVTQQTAHGDRHVYASRSRFIPDALTALFESAVWPLAARDVHEADAPRAPAPPVDIAARVLLRWRTG